MSTTGLDITTSANAVGPGNVLIGSSSNGGNVAAGSALNGGTATISNITGNRSPTAVRAWRDAPRPSVKNGPRVPARPVSLFGPGSDQPGAYSSQISRT